MPDERHEIQSSITTEQSVASEQPAETELDRVLWRIVMEGLTDCIRSHGPITRNYLSSATKRVIANIIETPEFRELCPDDLYNKLIVDTLEFHYQQKLHTKHKHIQRLQERLKALQQEKEKYLKEQRAAKHDDNILQKELTTLRLKMIERGKKMQELNDVNQALESDQKDTLQALLSVLGIDSPRTDMKSTVWHVKKPTFGFCLQHKYLKFPMHYECVAEVLSSNPDDAFYLTNTVNHPWWENSGVVALKKGRSTSVGDVILMSDNKTLYLCMPAGWKKYVGVPQRLPTDLYHEKPDVNIKQPSS